MRCLHGHRRVDPQTENAQFSNLTLVPMNKFKFKQHNTILGANKSQVRYEKHKRGPCKSYGHVRHHLGRPPNGTKLDRRSTGGVPRPLGKPWAIPRKFNTRTRKEAKGAPEDIGVSDCKTDNGENARMHETNMYENAMHMMTRYEMHDTQALTRQ